MVNAESSVEQLETYLAALEVEEAGYARRLAGAGKNGFLERLSVDQLKARVAGVKAEAKRAEVLLDEAKKAAAAA
jgi:hypothetical protein